MNNPPADCNISTAGLILLCFNLTLIDLAAAHGYTSLLRDIERLPTIEPRRFA